MPRRTDEHRDIEINVSEDAVDEALAMWITKYHGIEVDRKSIEVIRSEDGKISAKITKRGKKEAEKDASGDSAE